MYTITPKDKIVANNINGLKDLPVLGNSKEGFNS